MLKLRYFIFAILAAFLVCSTPAQQISVTGQEKIVTYTGTLATLAPPNTPASSFVTGFNTFILAVQPTVSVRVYITNNTANACLGTFTIQMSVASDRQTSSFNNSLNNWQSVPLQLPSGGLGNVVSVDVPASGTSFVSSTAISGPTVAIQVVNNNPASPCSTTNVEITAVLTSVSVTSPLVSVGGGGFGAGTLSNVQGITASGTNGSLVLPVVGGALQPASNALTASLGLDTFAISTNAISGNQTSSSTLFPPTPSQGGEFILAITNSPGFGTVNNVSGTGYTNSVVGATPLQTFTATFSANSKMPLTYTFTNSSASCAPPGGFNCWYTTQFLLFSKTPTSIRNGATGNQTVNQVLGTNTLAGDALVISYGCSTVACVIAPSDTQGLTWRQIALSTVPSNNGGTIQTYSTWIAGPTTAGADTITFNVSSGTGVGSMVIELAGIPAAPLNRANTSLANSNPLAISGENDNGGTFEELGGFSYQQTFTFSAVGTTPILLWNQAQHGLFQSGCQVEQRVTAISGTGATLNTYLQDSADQAGWNDRLSMVQSTTVGGANNQIGTVGQATVASLAPVASMAVATTDGTLTAGSAVGGLIGPFGRIKFVVAGTTPSVTVTVSVTCR